MSPLNGVILQFFHWYTPDDGSLWGELASSAGELARRGFTALWLPPCGKGAQGPRDVGYAAYDLFDLGEFDQKGSIWTKYGTKDQLVAAVAAAQAAGLQVYADVVFNHKDGADQTELVRVQEVDWERRNESRGGWEDIHAWTKFTFPGRAGRHSSMVWDSSCFDALCYNADTKDSSRLFRLKDKQFSTEVSHEHGNYDYLMANDLDTSHPAVQAELHRWGEWFLETTGVDGFRLDACKHIRASFFPGWLGHLRGKYGRELFSVGEYWSQRVGELLGYLRATGGATSLFDVPLHYAFHRASREGAAFDLRTIFGGTLVESRPERAVTFVDNHDTQPCQSLLSPVEPWFKPHAYALILLRQGGYPCVFYADYHGATYTNCLGGQPPVILYSHRFLIDRFLAARRAYGFGDQHDYFEHPNAIGWVRTGDPSHPGAMAVAMSNAGPASVRMNVFRPGASFSDATGHLTGKVVAGADGWGNFRCPAGNVSVWLQD